MKKQVLILQPSYLKDFNCIGNRCEYHCCKEWKVSIDKKTFKKYRKIDRKNSIKSKINRMVLKNDTIKRNDNYEYAKIELSKENGNCPFLNKEGLCDIYINCGADYLSVTCNQYPRILNKIDNCIEMSCQISCPEIVKCLMKKETISFDQFYTQIDLDKYKMQINIQTHEEGINKYFWKLRERSIDIMQDRSFNIEQRLLILGLILNKIQQAIDNGEDELEYIIDMNFKKYHDQSIKKSFSKLIDNDIVKLSFIESICNTKVKENNELFNEFLKGMNYSVEMEQNLLQTYKNGYERYLEFFKDRQFILENYIVNDIFMNVFPIKNGCKIFEEYGGLIIKFIILKLFLVGIGNFNNELSENIVIKTMYLYSRNIEHTNLYIEEVLKSIKDNNNCNMAYLSVLIRK